MAAVRDVVGLWIKVSVFFASGSPAGGRLRSPSSRGLLAVGRGPAVGQGWVSLPSEPELPAPGPLRTGRTALALTCVCWHSNSRSGV